MSTHAGLAPQERTLASHSGKLRAFCISVSHSPHIDSASQSRLTPATKMTARHPRKACWHCTACHTFWTA